MSNVEIHQQAEIHLQRLVKDAESLAEVDQESLAGQGVPYSQRMKLVEEAEKAKPKAEALRYALQRLRFVGPGDTD